MINKITAINYLGDTLEIDLRTPDETGFAVIDIAGLGPAKANVNITEVSTNDGAIFNSSRLSSRNVVISFVFEPTTHGETVEDVRLKSYKFFPIKQPVTLQIETNNRKVQTVGNVESNEPDIFSERESAQISIVCPDPYFYSTDGSGEQTTVFYGVEANFEFPFSNESLTDPQIVFGYIQNKTENVIHYSGDAEIGVTIHIHAIGDVTNIMIYNTGTRERMGIDTAKLEQLTGYGLIAGDDIIITTMKGDKSIVLIREGKITNILNCLSKDTDWFSLTKGDNIFAFTAEDGMSNLQFWIVNKIIYEGV